LYELGINPGTVNPRLVVYPGFIPLTAFCVLSMLWNRVITILGRAKHVQTSFWLASKC